MAKQKLTLYVDRELVKKVKIRGIEEGRSLSGITEDLYQLYLKRKGKPKT